MRGRGVAAWVVVGAMVLCLPLVAASSSVLTLLSQAAIGIVLCASYGLLLGHAGLLSFGHAVYPALGAYAGVYLLRALPLIGWSHPLAVAAVPLASALGALAAAALLGWPQVRRAGTVFGMVTLGVGELFYALALAFSAVSGGEGGISANRVQGSAWLGLRWATPAQLYALIAVYLMVGLALYQGLLRSRAGYLLHAVRDNPVRLAYTGLHPQGVRFLALLVSAFLAGLAGGLSALLFEIATPEAFSTHHSAQVLVFSVLGGTGSWLGACLGGLGMTAATVWLSTVTPAWMFYTGVAFCTVVLVSPGGLAQRGVWSKAGNRPGWRLAALVSAGVGLVLWTEVLYRRVWAPADLPASLSSDSAMVLALLGGVAWVLAGWWGWRARRPRMEAL